jgi:hypothetical protein
MACYRGFLFNQLRSEDAGVAGLRGQNETLKNFDDDDAGKPPSLFLETRPSSESVAESFPDDGAEFPASLSPLHDIEDALNDANDKETPAAAASKVLSMEEEAAVEAAFVLPE